LRHPLGRLHHDVETFRYRAVGDSVLSVDQMEEARTHYRASLRWMQDISSNLDPEQYKKLEKFRKVSCTYYWRFRQLNDNISALQPRCQV